MDTNVASVHAQHDVGVGEVEQSDKAVTKTAFTTEGLPASQQFDAYREYCAPVIDLLPSGKDRLSFNASCQMSMLGRLALRRVHTPGGQFARGAAQVRCDGLDHWVFDLVNCGKREVRTSTGMLTTGAGVLSVFSLAGAYDGRRTNGDWLGLFVPRGVFPGIDKAFNPYQHLVLDNALGRLFSAYLISLADELPSITEADLPRAIEATRTIVTTCIESSAKVLESGDAYFEMPRQRRVRDIIDQNLGSWSFHTGRLCKLAGVSRSNLYRMFEPYGGVVRYMQRQRLLGAHDRLADPTCIRPISLIANDYCFSDAPAFSRAFRREFDYSPSDVRKYAKGIGITLANGLSRPRRMAKGAWDMLYPS